MEPASSCFPSPMAVQMANSSRRPTTSCGRLTYPIATERVPGTTTAQGVERPDECY
jgi:hypothetical protein